MNELTREVMKAALRHVGYINSTSEGRLLNQAEKTMRELAPRCREELEKPQRQPEIRLEVYQWDWVEGFAAFVDTGGLAEGAPAHIALNLGSILCAVENKDLDAKDVPYVAAESLMHEVVHALEAWANVEFSEERVEELTAKYRASIGLAVSEEQDECVWMPYKKNLEMILTR